MSAQGQQKIDLSNLQSLEARHEKFYKYLKHCLVILPESIVSLDSSKLDSKSFLFFHTYRILKFEIAKITRIEYYWPTFPY